MKLSPFILLIFTLLACKQSPPKPTIEDELNELTSDILKKEYLEALYDKDQGVRKEERKEGKMNDVDAANLKVVEAYLSKYGYPNKELLGRKSALVPWLVIHHQQTTQGQPATTRRKYFKVLYQAYLDGHIEDTAISLYLNRIYQSENGKRYEIESPYMPQDEIDQLVNILNLEL